ncbi:MAG TPA: MarR family transcriptional regulator [Solirubrobacteraceae bacterium]|jgi:DNA-binding MarR family transcriptional regulator|nr:MarR family transcriptional regulator [Solirubrobacteraceae bacterium]
MQNLVLAEDRNQELRDALGLGRGSGRVKLLLSLAGGALSLGDLSASTGADAPYVTLIVNELEARGLVTRTPDAVDRRRKLVSLTNAGQDAVDAAREIVSRPPTFFEKLSRQELEQLSVALRGLDAP